MLLLFLFNVLSCNAFVQHSPAIIFGAQHDSTGRIRVLPSLIGSQYRVRCTSSCLLSRNDSSANNDDIGSEELKSVYDSIDDRNEEKLNQNKEREEVYQQYDPQVETSLSKVLAKARGRKMVLLPYQIQAFFNNPVLTLTKPLPAIFTIGDVSFVFVAIWLDSLGFALGYSIGKLTSRSVRWNFNMPLILTELWTVGLAIGFDIIWRNVG